MITRVAALSAALLALAGVARAQDAPKGGLIGDPVWTSIATSTDNAKALPARAKAKRVNGHVTLSCTVGADGRFTACGVMDETPLDFGFGDAAIVVADKYRMQPKSRSGKPTEGGEVVFPVDFYADQDKSMGTLLLKPVWLTAPTRQDVAQAYAALPSPKPASTRTIFRCNVQKTDGALSACQAVSTLPEGAAAEAAATALVSRFRVNLAPERGRITYPAYVEFAVMLADAPAAALLADPKWTRGPTAQAVHDAFPKTAAAGVDHGQVGLDCVADSAGAMSGCTVLAEAPKDMAFGASAVQLAGQMGVNPWTSDGRPAEGAHVRFAVRLDRPTH